MGEIKEEEEEEEEGEMEKKKRRKEERMLMLMLGCSRSNIRIEFSLHQIVVVGEETKFLKNGKF